MSSSSSKWACESLGLSSSLPSDHLILISLRFICYIVSDDIHTVVFKTTTPCDYQLKTMPTWQCIPQSVLAYSHWCFNLRHCCKPFKSTIHVLRTELLLLLKLLSCQKGIRHLLVTHVKHFIPCYFFFACNMYHTMVI